MFDEICGIDVAGMKIRLRKQYEAFSIEKEVTVPTFFRSTLYPRTRARTLIPFFPLVWSSGSKATDKVRQQKENNTMKSILFTEGWIFPDDWGGENQSFARVTTGQDVALIIFHEVFICLGPKMPFFYWYSACQRSDRAIMSRTKISSEF